MSKKIKKDEPIAPDQALSKAEAFVTKHKKAFIIAILAIFAFVGFNAFNEDATEKKENTEAEAAIANIEATWQGIQPQAALDSFLEIIDLYNGTNAANKAHFYAGIIYSQQENYEEAINHLSKYNGSDKIIAPKAKQLLGNCYSQIEDYDNAIRLILEAASLANNVAVTPACWRDVAAMYEAQGKNDKAMNLYKKIKDEYPYSPVANEAKVKLNAAK